MQLDTRIEKLPDSMEATFQHLEDDGTEVSYQIRVMKLMWHSFAIWGEARLTKCVRKEVAVRRAPWWQPWDRSTRPEIQWQEVWAIHTTSGTIVTTKGEPASCSIYGLDRELVTAGLNCGIALTPRLLTKTLQTIEQQLCKLHRQATKAYESQEAQADAA